ncbi:hypothetical protein ACIA5G_49360 [Amycolatopsis sp. NPDC051758]|uniref:hypothetical protein n=1 Tax=Amycolatopsis sp. NPDC051758 TaxID=3363935 RepID=UPI0037BE00E5
MTANAYTFLPWLRAGISARVDTDPGTAERASVDVELIVSGDPISGDETISAPVTRAVQLYGPGDVVGVDPRAISRVEPRPGVASVEPNFLAHIEFVEEDFPWRYSPAPSGPSTRRLAPWLALVVLATGTEFTDAPGADPLPAVDVTDPAGTLPPPDQLGAWAHVHVDGSLTGPVATDSTGDALANLQEVLRANPDSACSRLVCPRHLEPDTAYQAFLVPAFETGRLAGLGLDPAVSPGALHAAWGPSYPGRPAGNRLPYYHRWGFRTGTAGDFEFLVRLLTPGRADATVGRRPMDVHRSPGFDIDGIEEHGGVLPLGGALRVPNVDDPAENWDNFAGAADQPPYPHPFQRALAGLVDLADDYQRRPPAPTPSDPDPDPIITPPLYGRWHALTSRLLNDKDGTPVSAEQSHNWVHRLNLDPRFRAAANLGAQVVRTREEELMAAAWAQVGDVLVANGRIRAAQLAREVGHVLQVKHVDPPAGASLTALAGAPARSGRALTLTAPAHPRVTTTSSGGAPGLVASAADTVAVGFRVASSRVAAAPVSPEMRRIVRPGARLVKTLDFPEGRRPDGLLSRMDDPVAPVVAAPVKVTPGALVTPRDVTTALHPERPADADPVDVLPHSPDFVLRSPGDPAVPRPGATDSDEAKRFKAALRELHQGFDAGQAVGRTPEPPALDLAVTTTDTLAGLRADDTVPRALLDGSVRLPERLRPFAEQFTEAMAYPVFDVPMFRSLLDVSVDTFVPNLALLPSNSLTLLENNYEFIEAFLAGLNHEMARELLWREFPTDQRGTPFRQFWDALSPAGDIPPLHQWSPATRLGDNAHRRGDLVLVVRGELLRKYPTTAVYAHRAEWPPGPDGLPDPSKPRRLVEPPSAEHIKLPRYEATVDPDIYLLGFDLTAEQAVGGPADPGWFFVLKERPGDPRFGVDDGPPVPVEVWNDLTWSDVDPTGRGFLVLDPAVTVALAGFDGSDDDAEKADQRAEDENLPQWSAGLSSADLAYLLFQVPVMVAVHAKEMVPR